MLWLIYWRNCTKNYLQIRCFGSSNAGWAVKIVVTIQIPASLVEVMPKVVCVELTEGKDQIKYVFLSVSFDVWFEHLRWEIPSPILIPLVISKQWQMPIFEVMFAPTTNVALAIRVTITEHARNWRLSSLVLTICSLHTVGVSLM